MTRPAPARPSSAQTSSGILSNSLYRLPRCFVHEVAYWPRDRDALRLLHVLLYRTYRDCQSWWLGTDPQPEEGYSVTFRDVHGWQGTCPERGNGTILAAMDRLRATGAFAVLVAEHRNQVLRWRLTDDAYACLFADDTFGYLDIRILPHCRDVMTLILLGHLALVRGMRKPSLELQVEGLHNVQGLMAPTAWKAVRRPLLSALRTLGTVHGLRVVVGLAWHHRLPGIDTLHVRLEHARTIWKTIDLGRFDHRVREVIVLDPAGEHRMSPAALPAYLATRGQMPP